MSYLVEGERYEFVGGASRKFWEWRLYDDTEGEVVGKYWRLRFRWGRLGTGGQSMDERFDSEALARWKAKAKVTEKLGKGYRLAQRGPVDAPSKAPPPAWRRPALDREAKRIGRAVLGLDKPKPEPAPLATVRRVRLRD